MQDWFVMRTMTCVTQDACEGADGTRIAGRRMRVSLAKPRHRGPRERFFPGSYRGEYAWNSQLLYISD